MIFFLLFRPISCFISKTIQDVAIVTMDAIYRMVPFSMTFNDP